MKELGGECYRIIDAEYDTAQKLLITPRWAVARTALSTLTDLWLGRACRVPLLERRPRDRELELARELVERRQPGPPRNSLHFSSDFASGEFLF